MRAVAYCRVSTNDQASNGLSLDAQQTRVSAYCQAYDLDLVGVIVESGSAKNISGMPGLQEVLRLVEDRAVEAVLVVKLDRLVRSVADGLAVLDFLAAKKVEFHSVAEAWNTSTAMGKFALNLMLSLAQLECEQIGERTSEALQDKKARAGGRQINGNPPYGWWWKGGALVEHEAEQFVVGQIQRMREVGKSAVAIAEALSAKNFRTRTGRLWSERMVGKVRTHLL